MREARTVYASFVNLMEGAHAVLMQNKVKFELDPLTKAAMTSNFKVSSIPDHLTLIGREITDMENKINAKD
jgi:hypothetical protein